MPLKLKKLPQALRTALASHERTQPVARTVPGTMEIRAAADDTAELLIYGNIGDSWWDETVTAKSVVEQLGEIAASRILVRINSYGGSVTDGIAIYNALRAKAGDGTKVDVQVDGIAASIASLIAMAGDTVTMPDNALMMLHAPWGLAIGNSADIREYAEVLDTYGQAMATSYARKTGKPASEFESMWATGKDHWYTAAEAVEAGLADATVSAEDPEEDAEAEEAAAGAPALRHMLARAPQQIAAQVRGLLHPSTSEPARSHAAPSSRPAVAGTHPPAAAGNREEPTMPQSNNAPAADVTAATQKAATDAVAALRSRNSEIKALAQPHLGNEDVRAYYDQVIEEADPDVTAADVGKKILAILAKGRESLGGNAHVQAGDDDRDKQRTAMARAIDIRIGVAKAEGENPYRGFTMFEIARACAERAGVNTRGMERMDVVGSAFTHSTSDFPHLLADVAQKALRRGYEESPEVFDQFTRAVTLTDFKPTSLAGLGRFSNLDLIPEGGEYKYGTFNDAGLPLKLATFGKLFSVTRQAVINDDLNALSDVPRKMGQAARRTVGNAVFALMTSNPELDDGKTLFHVDRNNLVSPGSTITTESVDGLRVLMATQKDADGNIVRVPLKYLVVPVGLGGAARTVLESQFEVGASSRNNTTPNIVRNAFEVVEDPRLDAADPKAWYGVADPAFYDGIVVGYLDGRQEPYLESKQGWNVDGTEWKVRIDAAAAVADPIALAKNEGGA